MFFGVAAPAYRAPGRVFPAERSLPRPGPVASLLAGALAALLPSPGSGAPVPVEPGFEVEVVASGLDRPTGVAFAPDGRIFVAEKSGTVRVIRNGAVAATPFIRLTDVNIYGDRGLHGIALDPRFSENGHVYLLYTHENTPGVGLTAPKTGRLVRVTAVGDVASESSKVVILGTVGGTFDKPSCEDYEPTADCIPSDSQAHSVGALRIGPDGMLYVSMGDGAQFTYADPRSMRAQDVDRLSGKVLRIRTDGTAPPDNPFFDGDPRANRSKVWMYGLRYPYRFGFRPADGSIYIGDVGWRSWEEVDHGPPGSNFGWPCYEGDFPTEHDCAVAGVTYPIHAYSTANGAAIIGGAFPGASYPAEHRNSFFFGDYVKDHVRRMVLDDNGDFVSVGDFVTSAGGPVDVQVGPDGDLYYLGIFQGELLRIVHTAGNRRPTAEISADPTSGLAPLSVAFSAAGSFDPDGDPLGFEWTFGDGASSTAQEPVHTYAAEGVHPAILKVSDPEGRFDVKSVTITVGNRAPVATITSPANSSLYDDLDVIRLASTGVDPEDGPLPASAFHWQIILHHNVHFHFLEELDGPEPSFVAPDHGATDVYLEAILTVTDREGLTGRTSINLYRNNSPFEEGQNIVGNPSLEVPDPAPGLPLGWRKGGFGTNTAVLRYPVPGLDGDRAARIDISSYTSGDRKWYFDPVWVTPGREYRFADAYRSDSESRITVELGKADGTHVYLNLGTLPPSTTWLRVETTFTVPADVRTATVFHGLRSVGFLEVDDYWLGLPDRTAPEVSLATPAADEVVSGTLRVEASARDAGGLSSVVFLLDGFAVREELHPPYTLYLDTTLLAEGAHVIAARGLDASGNQVTSARRRFFVLNHEPPGPSLVANPSVETASPRPDVPAGFRKGGYGEQEAAFVYPVPGRTGSSAVRIDVTSYTSGQVRWYFDDVPVTPGVEYLFSDYYASTVPAGVWARFTLADGSAVHPFLGGTPPSSEWRRARFVFVAPANAVSVTVFHSLGAAGTLVTDDFFLGPSGNLLSNPALELDSAAPGRPLGWRMGGYGQNERSFSYPVPGVTPGRGMRVAVTDHASGDAKWYSDDVPVVPGATYRLSGYYRSSAETTMKVRIRLQDGSLVYPLLGRLAPTSGWRRAEFELVAPPEAASLSVFHFLDQVGFLDTDELSLRRTR